TILGATGSIGRSTLDVVARHPERYYVHALAANRQHEALAQQCLRFSPRYAVLADADAAHQLRARLAEAGCATQVLSGAAAAVEVASAAATDVVMAAVVGGAGLEPVIAAARAGKRILL